MKNDITPVIISVMPVIIPELYSKPGQFNFKLPLYAIRTQSTIPVTEIHKYSNATINTNDHPLVPAIRKYASISKQGEKNIATINTNIILKRFSVGLGI